MVAKIAFPKRVTDALNYNEQKVQKGMADCLYAHNFLSKGADLNFYQKLEGLELRNSLNDRAATQTLHVSLNFSPQDRKLDEATLVSIAKQYMQGLGFGSQPFLVYRHGDAGHPHLHIVSTTIREDGSRIATHNLGKVQSSQTRLAIERDFGLVPASGRKAAIADTLRPNAMPQPLVYGKDETKKGLASIVSHVFRNYAFTTLPEYNAALRQFNVVADRGKEESRTFRHGGLYYRMLDEQGGKVGVPIKASSLPQSPTLANLEKRFLYNKLKKPIYLEDTIRHIDGALQAAPENIAALQKGLEGKKIYLLPRYGKEGRLYGLTYVDNNTRCVFNGSDLGKRYTAAGIEALLQSAGGITKASLEHRQEGSPKQQQPKTTMPMVGHTLQPQKVGSGSSITQALFIAKESPDNTSSPLLKKKKKSKRRGYQY